MAFGTGGLMFDVWNDCIAVADESAVALMILVGIGRIAITNLFLILVIGSFLNRELEAKGLGSQNE